MYKSLASAFGANRTQLYIWEIERCFILNMKYAWWLSRIMLTIIHNNKNIFHFVVLWFGISYDDSQEG